jgi:threonine dehydratase
VLHGDTFDDAYAHAREIGAAEGRVFIHPYDDPDVIAGQGTIAAEILRQSSTPIDACSCRSAAAVLIAGIAAYIKAVSPETRVIGVEPDDSNAMQAALAAGERVTLPSASLFADGVGRAPGGRRAVPRRRAPASTR